MDNYISLQRVTLRQFIRMLDDAAQDKKGDIKRRVVFLTPRNAARLERMEDELGISVTQMVNDMIKEHYDTGFETTNG